MPSYSGGLGVLAGDTIRAAADLRFPMVAISLLYRSGYFTQRLSAEGAQIEDPAEWQVSKFVEEETARVHVPLEDRRVELRCWRYDAIGVRGAIVPVYFLDADLPSNEECDRALTGTLYGGDAYYRLRQEVLLGIGGIRMLRALGHTDILRYHMNEGHAALLTLELLAAQATLNSRTSIRAEDIEIVRKRCVFTTHTPVPAGHDKFPLEYMLRVFPGETKLFDLKDAATADLVKRVLESPSKYTDLREAAEDGASVNMTHLAISLSSFINGVAKLHGATSRKMFPGVPIESITNGVHAKSWTCPPFQQLFDAAIPDWKEDNFSLREALAIPREKIWSAHLAAKQTLFREVTRKTGLALDPAVFTIGFARRFTGYKRADLILYDLDRLREIAQKSGAFQIIYAGKAHPRDAGGADLIRRIFKAKKALRKSVTVVFLDNYNLDLGQKITSGVDLWLNTPQYPLEASGTSGMKAALNGVPSLSVLDGWWVEGHMEGITGWSIGEPSREPPVASDTGARTEAESLYSKLQNVIIPMFYGRRDDYVTLMQHTIAINGSFFNTQRMVHEYITQAYLG